jgi:hypothetical protein
MDRKRDPRGQGDLGERSAMLWFGAKGAAVFLPCFHSPDFDLVVDWGHGLVRVQVKTCACFRNERWSVAVCTRGGNQSWSRIVKKLDPRLYDYLFVHVGDGRRWYIPSGAVGGSCSINLGGPLYSEYEIDPGDPLPAYSASVSPASQR